MTRPAPDLAPPDDAAPVRPSRAATWVVRVVVGIAVLVTVGLVVALAGYAVVVSRMGDAGSSSEPPPTTEQDVATEGDGLGGDGLDRSNDAYRERLGSPEGDAQAALSIPAVEAALSPLATGGPLQREAVVAALTGAGFDSFGVTPETTPSGDVATTFGVGVSVPGGCVYGGVTPGAVTLDAGGPIADGGCLEMPAH
jgi:hypothetical protein